jgi:hypothetical protein
MSAKTCSLKHVNKIKAPHPMTLEEFAQLISGFAGMSHIDRIKHFAWYVHTQDKKDRFAAADITWCYDQLHLVKPGNVHALLLQLAGKKQPELLKDSRGYRLEARVRDAIEGKYGSRPITIAVSAMLTALPGKVSDEAERLFLSEALTCYRSGAFRAAIVMTWNLAYDHLVTWVLSKHLVAFNAAIPKKYTKRTSVTMAKKEDFADEFTEFEVLEVCGVASIIDGNTKKILNEKLSKRNMAAHPSLVEITIHQAEDVISDLVNNVILKLT